MNLWPFRRRCTDPPRPSEEELDHALRQAERALTDARELRCRADSVADRLSRTRERNHFAAAVARAIRGV